MAPGARISERGVNRSEGGGKKAVTQSSAWLSVRVGHGENREDVGKKALGGWSV